MARISVVMPTFNRAATLPRAIDSVLRQTHRDVELIVVDDGSTDGTAALLQRYAGRLTAICLDVNAGGNAARNRGIERASGEIICFLDSDDEFLPHKLAYVDEYFEARPDVDVLVDSYEVVFPPEHKRHALPRRNPVLSDSRELRTAVFARHIYKATPAISARRTALLEIGMFDTTLRRRQDMDLILRLTRAHRCASTDQKLWLKLWTPNAISRERNTFLAAAIEICHRHPDYLNDPAHRKGLEHDIGRHFWWTLVGQGFGGLRDELKRYSTLGHFGGPPWLLMLQGLRKRR
jgi:glycosyltransferase involved in cell wall biosynthesis